MAEETKDNGWYVAIINFGGGSIYHFIGAGSSEYKIFKDISRRNGIEVMAERFNISDEICIKISQEYLERIVVRIRAGEKFDVQKELDSICA